MDRKKLADALYQGVRDALRDAKPGRLVNVEAHWDAATKKITIVIVYEKLVVIDTEE